jgi:hypothetical protein
MRKEALDHFRILMRRRDKPDGDEYWIIPIPTGHETIRQCIDLHRVWNVPDMPIFDPLQHIVHMAILQNGTVKNGVTFEDIYKETKGKAATLLDVPGYSE